MVAFVFLVSITRWHKYLIDIKAAAVAERLE